MTTPHDSDETLDAELVPPANPFRDQPDSPQHNPYASPYAQPPSPPPGDLGDDPAMRMLLPVGRSGWAIVAGYLGLIGLAICPAGPFAVICGIMAIREIRRDPKLHGLGRAWTGIILGTIGTIGLILFMIVGGAAAILD